MTTAIVETADAMKGTEVETEAEIATTTETVTGGETTEIEGTAPVTIAEMIAIATTAKTTERSRRPTMHSSRCWPVQGAALAATTETDETAMMTATMIGETEMASQVSPNGRSRL